MNIEFIVLGDAREVNRSEALWPIYCDDTGFPFAYAPNKEAQKFIAAALHLTREPKDGREQIRDQLFQGLVDAFTKNEPQP